MATDNCKIFLVLEPDRAALDLEDDIGELMNASVAIAGTTDELMDAVVEAEEEDRERVRSNEYAVYELTATARKIGILKRTKQFALVKSRGNK